MDGLKRLYEHNEYIPFQFKFNSIYMVAIYFIKLNSLYIRLKLYCFKRE